mgnify:CR=1 FL=1
MRHDAHGESPHDMRAWKRWLLSVVDQPGLDEENLDESLPLFHGQGAETTQHARTEHLSPAEWLPDIGHGAGASLGLDSVDAVLLVTALERDHGVRFRSVADAREAFASLRALADYVAARHGRTASPSSSP